MKRSPHVLFVPHGSPMFALEPGAAGAAIKALATQLPAPRAVLVLSPHWDTAVPTVGTAPWPPTLHDFGGFDPRLFDLQYPAPGHPDAAGRVVAALTAAGLPVHTDSQRGLDHGAWVPLRYLFADATVPVVPLSMQHAGGPAHAYRVGQALAPLVDAGFPMVASGNITHNLHDWQRTVMTGQPTPAYVQQFADWVHTQVSSHNIQALLSYRQTQAAGRLAHPQDDHLLPLFSALGAAGPTARPRAFFRGISDVVIAMDGYTFETDTPPPAGAH